MAGFEARQGAILVSLNADRSAEELAQLVGLGLKRVRHLLRTYREASAHGDPGDGSHAAPAAPAPPTARPVGEDVHPAAAVGAAAAAVEGDASPAGTTADVPAPPAAEQRPGDGDPLSEQYG